MKAEIRMDGPLSFLSHSFSSPCVRVLSSSHTKIYNNSENDDDGEGKRERTSFSSSCLSVTGERTDRGARCRD